jgi:AraC-like DNA-binding protein
LRVRPATLEEFLEQPDGRFVVGRTWIYFCASPALAGCVLWGHVDEADVAELVKVAPATHPRTAKPHGALLDARRVEHADASAFSIMQRYFAFHQPALSAVVKRLAIVRPDGFAGTIAGGFFRVVPAPYTVEVFASAAEAFAWLDHDDGGALLDELDAIQREAEAVAPIQRELRALLASSPQLASVESAAVALHLSGRTLQRRLREAKTSFRNELAIARMEQAQRLMIEGSLPLTTIAFEVGFASHAHFSAQFRKVTGETPGAWRARRRPPPSK